VKEEKGMKEKKEKRMVWRKQRKEEPVGLGFEIRKGKTRVVSVACVTSIKLLLLSRSKLINLRNVFLNVLLIFPRAHLIRSRLPLDKVLQ